MGWDFSFWPRKDWVYSYQAITTLSLLVVLVRRFLCGVTPR